MASIDGEVLSPQHLKELRESAISDDQFRARGYSTEFNPRNLPRAFTGEQRRPGLLIPIWNVLGEEGTWQLKPDNPRHDESGKPIKYETPAKANVCIDVPDAARPLLLDVEADLWITEGAKKVDSAVCHGILSIVGLLGVSMWQRDGVAVPDWKEIALKGRRVVIAFDSDVMNKPSVRWQLEQLAGWLQLRGANVHYCLMPHLPDGSKCGLDDYLASGGTRADLEALVVDSLPVADTDWQKPLPFDDPSGPPFPLDALPGTLRRYVTSVAESTQTPSGMAAVMALGTISAAARGRYDAYVPGHDWTEPVLIQAVVFALPGERKSAVVKELTAPIQLWEREQQSSEVERLSEWLSNGRVLEKQLKSAEEKASKGRVPGFAGPDPDDLDRIRQAAALELATHDRQPIFATRVIADDITPEKAQQMMVEQGGALAVISSEGTFFAILAGRYSDQPHLEVMLKGHAGEPLTIDRKGAPSLQVLRGCLTIAVACQPHVAETMGGVDGFQQRGGAARILPAFPASAVGTRAIEAPQIPPALRGIWSVRIRTILGNSSKHPFDDTEPSLPAGLPLDPDAYAVFQHYRARHEAQLRPEGAFGDITDWGSKLPGAVLRIAGIMHIWSQDVPEDHPIGVETIRGAIEIGAYFAQHARVMYRVMARRAGQSAARQVLDAIRSLGSPTTKRDIHRKLQDRVRFQKSDDLNEPLALLEDYGWIRMDRNGKTLRVYLNPLGNPDNTDDGLPSRLNSHVLSVLSGSSGDEHTEDLLHSRPVEALLPNGSDGARLGEIAL